MEFLTRNDEDSNYNQYWYSTRTIEKIVEELIELDGRIAFLSTPSLYFSIPENLRNKSKIFDYDVKWLSDPGFVHYDFNNATNIPEELTHQFDIIIIDPPFITEEVWRKYAESAKLLLADGPENALYQSKVILTTVFENASLLHELFGAIPQAFKPSIPHLVYQYTLYTNYESKVFSQKNPEIPE